MSFKSVSQNSIIEKEDRIGIKEKILNFGISFLDEATYGIFPGDLILLGAPSGVGKTQLCINIAMSNIERGKKIHFFALEANQFEIERRLKYQILADCFFNDADKPKLKSNLTFPKWFLGEFDEDLKKYDEYINHFMESAFKHYFIFYKWDKFNIDDLISNVLRIKSETDLIIIDHVHYFDWDDLNDNRAIKNIAMNVRNLSIDYGIPIILVAHLRKKDRYNKELVPGLDEFHGSSDLYKIATKVITLSSGSVLEDGNRLTYFRIPKCRMDSSPTSYVAKTIFNMKKRSYENEYKIGFANTEEFEELEIGRTPQWAQSARNSSISLCLSERRKITTDNMGKENGHRVFNPSERD